MSYITREIPEGAIRYNTDSNKMEVWIGDKWMQVSVSSPNLAESGDTSVGARGLFAGGGVPVQVNVIQAFNIAVQGNTFDFGDLTEIRYYAGGASSKTRAVWAGGIPAGTPESDTIDFVTISSLGDATAFGELVGTDRSVMAGFANQTRACFAGGEAPSKVDEIDFVTIASTANALDFGNLTQARSTCIGLASPTRGVVIGGSTPTYVNTIDFVTIASTGDAQDFGDQYEIVYGGGAGGNATRGVMMGGAVPADPSKSATIQYLTIATRGNTLDFGDLTQARRYGACCSSPTRAVYCGGLYPSVANVMDSINIATTGNAIDFGDLFDHTFAIMNGCSNAHGGL